MKVSRWTYPLVNAGHILGIALLIGAVVPMDLRILRGINVARTVALLRPFAVAGLLLAMTCGLMLFIVQPVDYAASPWFRAKLVLLALAIGNAVLHPRIADHPLSRQRVAVVLSLALWPSVLIAGRMIAYG
nr:hypothetical protein [Pararhodobacter sp. SW119]